MTPSKWHLGNDIVDLADPRHQGKADDDRFLRRVCSEREREEILSAHDPDRALWIRWVGKEAAFKTVSKALGSPPIFIHPKFEVTVENPAGWGSMNGSPPMTRFGEVRYLDFRLPLRIELADTALHAVTWEASSPAETPPFSWGSTQVTPARERWKEEMEAEFSPREWACISHRASALARLAARKSLASTLDVEEADLEVGCGPGKPGRRIPKVFLRGREFAVDLSLSHHGSLLAWAFLNHSQGR